MLNNHDEVVPPVFWPRTLRLDTLLSQVCVVRGSAGKFVYEYVLQVHHV